MSDPKRLSMASDSEFERALLRTARVAAPSGSKERALRVASSALAGSAAVAGGAAAGKGTALGMAKAGSIASLKWIGIVGLTGVGLTASAVAYHEVQDNRPPPVETSASPPQGRSMQRERTAERTPHRLQRKDGPRPRSTRSRSLRRRRTSRSRPAPPCVRPPPWWRTPVRRHLRPYRRS